MAREKKKFINLLFRRDFSNSELFRRKEHTPEPSHTTENIKNTYAKINEKSLSRGDIEGFRNRGFSYLGLFGDVSNYSKAIDVTRYNEGKVGRPRKQKIDHRLFNHTRKQKRKGQKRCSHSYSTACPPQTEVLTSLPPSTSVDEALDIIERRKKSIKAKVSVKKEHLLTQEEEQDIHTRADIYAITTAPDPQFYVIPEEDQAPKPTASIDETHINTVFPPAKKKRRRNYGNSNCYVAYHNNEDIFDNTKMLPIGTRLLKPPTKLVELVAQAIDGSPDGLLQVQQIYTFLQNRYPFFRYMERSSINSWRSSIRHALYQKWFRKIRFDLTYISSKGCYWAINHKTNPKEWTMPESNIWLNTDEDCCPLEIDSITHTDILTLLRDEKSDGDVTEGVLAVAREFGIDLEESKTAGEIEPPVKESDPVLATCAPGILNEDVYLSSTESFGNGSTSPVVGSSPCVQCTSFVYPQSYEYSNNIEDEFHSPVPSRHPTFHRHDRKSHSVSKPSVFSPIVNWTPNWDEYGSYILSPQSMSSHQQLFGVQVGRSSEPTSGTRDKSYLDYKNNYKSVLEDINSILASSSSPNFSSCTSETGSDVEIIAEFTKPSSESSDDNEDFDLIDV